MSTAYSAIAIGVANIAGAADAASDARIAGNEASAAATANAADSLQLAYTNIGIQNEVASFNAAMTLQLGFANAASVERNAVRNIELMAMEYSEEVRRHVIGEKELAGQIRSQFSSSGFQTNQGTPLMVLNNEMEESATERRWIVDKGKLTIMNYSEQERERANLIRLEASLNAQSIVFNSSANSAIYLNEAIASANATARGGAQAQSAAGNAANQILVQGVTSGASAIVSGIDRLP